MPSATKAGGSLHEQREYQFSPLSSAALATAYIVSEVTKYSRLSSGRFCSFFSSFLVAAKKPNTTRGHGGISVAAIRCQGWSSLKMQTRTSMLNDRIAQALATRPICKGDL